MNTDALFAIREGAALSRGRLWFDVRNIARDLPQEAYVLNLCQDRYLFCVALLAALYRGQVTLLPPSDRTDVLREILCEYPDTYAVFDRPRPPLPCPGLQVALSAAGAAAALDFDAGARAVIAFTSGSTGRPKACPKTWGTLETAAQLALRSLDLENVRRSVICTAPPQHMYGLETSVLWPLFSPLILHAERPFFPEDIRRAVGSAPLPAILVTTPTHLWSLVRTQGEWRNLWGIVSSTAGLSEILARRMEDLTGALLWEIYGSTETLSFAWRRTVHGAAWHPYPGSRLSRNEEGLIQLEAPHLSGTVRLDDVLHIEPDGCFVWLGRAGDLVKIGGKRASLADLNRRLTDIEGIVDGLFLTLEDERGECRLAAVVVSRLARREIRAALRQVVDEVFLPKRIHYLDKIPRTAVGKVAKETLEELLSTFRMANADDRSSGR